MTPAVPPTLTLVLSLLPSTRARATQDPAGFPGAPIENLVPGSLVFAMTPGPVTSTPEITTGAGDHFNSGFCLGKLLGLGDLDSLVTAVTTSAIT